MNLRQKYKKAKQELKLMRRKPVPIKMVTDQAQVEKICAQITVPYFEENEEYLQKIVAERLATSIVERMKLQRKIDRATGNVIITGTIKIICED